MIVYLKSVLSQTDDYPDLPTLSYQDKCNELKIVLIRTHSLSLQYHFKSIL